MPYVHLVEVLPADIDRLGHASNQVYLRWVLEAALAHSSALGLGEEDYFRMGQGWVVRRQELVYKKPALEGDELRVETRVTTMSAANSIRKTRVVRAKDGAELFEAVTDWVYVDLARGRPARIPPHVRARFQVE
jgi:acyl-CoA thioester hydrolase